MAKLQADDVEKGGLVGRVVILGPFLHGHCQGILRAAVHHVNNPLGAHVLPVGPKEKKKKRTRWKKRTRREKTRRKNNEKTRKKGKGISQRKRERRKRKKRKRQRKKEERKIDG